MYEDFMKMAQESMKPMLKMVENNTAMAVKLMQAQAETTAELMQSNLAHVQALAETKDLNVAVEMQQKYVETLNEKAGQCRQRQRCVSRSSCHRSRQDFRRLYGRSPGPGKESCRKHGEGNRQSGQESRLMLHPGTRLSDARLIPNVLLLQSISPVVS